MNKRVAISSVGAVAFAAVISMVVSTPAWATTSVNLPNDQTINSAGTALMSYGVAMSSDGTVYQSHFSANSIDVYATGADGTVTPTRVISGANTLISGPGGMGFGPNGELFVASYLTNKVLVFAPGADGDVAPIHTIDVGSIYPMGLSVSATGRLAVGGHSGTVVVDNPLTDSTPTINLTDYWLTDQNEGVVWDNDGGLYSGKPGYNTIVYLAPGFTASSTPTRSLNIGRMPWGLAYDTVEDNLIVQSSSQIYRYAKDADGMSPEPLETFSSTDTPIEWAYGIYLQGCNFVAGNQGSPGVIGVYEWQTASCVQARNTSGSGSDPETNSGSSETGVLANTGLSVATVGVASALLVAGGIGALSVSRRRRRS